jgi:hypothetical protein
MDLAYQKVSFFSNLTSSYRSIVTGKFTDRELACYVREMVPLLRLLINGLGDTVNAWDRFEHKDIGYFLFDDGLPTNSKFLKCSVNAVDDVFLDLKDVLKKLQQMECGLRQDSPQVVSNIFLYWPPNVALC